MNVVETIRRHFAFLESEYGFKIKKRRNDRHTPFVRYVADNVGVLVQYDVRDACFDASVYQLDDGQFPERNGYVVTRAGYSLNNIIYLDVPSAMVASQYGYDEGDERATLEGNAQEVARKLKQYAVDFLQGDFERGPAVRTAVQEMLAARK